MATPTTTPADLVEEFKNSGEFERLRRELLEEFMNGENIEGFKDRVEQIAKQRLAKDPDKLRHMDAAALQRDLKQEIDRYPVVERSMREVSSIRDEKLAGSVEKLLKQTLDQRLERFKKEAETTVNGAHSPPKEAEGGDVNE